jgi:hypothetical protein
MLNMKEKVGFCDNENLLINYTKLTSVDFASSRDVQGKKRGWEVPGPLQKVLGLLDFFSPGTTRPSRSLGPVPSRDRTVLLESLVDTI